MQCFILVCAVSVLWVTLGYTLVFGAGGIDGWIGGLEKVFLRTVTIDALSGTIPESVFVVFQLTFAAITPALIVGGFAEPMGALIIGASAGFTCYWATQLVKQRWVINDSLDVFSVHGIGGALGMLLTSVFVMSTLGGAGLPEGVSLASQFGVQALAVVATTAWSALVSYLALKVAGAVVLLRVGVDEEIEGLDLVNHEERGYNF
jgi:ammonia channel protein AmtB